ncbi:tubulin delta chain-like [Dermacentor silvarum]|uniref:tubulin delta chain-like n=1 Tax=Dermacentor silvarum TaxID=543639 RepID=UPI00189AA000|nr:tubulin delta chain-like [Dermacentor silvarum]
MSVLTLQIGQCGNQLGFEFFNVLAQDLGVGETETRRDSEYHSLSSERFFAVDPQGGLLASAVLVDTERKAVGRVLKEACNSNKWHYPSGAAYTSAQGAGNNWALGYFEHAEKGLDEICDLVRCHAEQRDWLDGFLPIFSLGGGTGSGLGTKLTETLRDDYPNTPVITAVVWPFKSGEVSVQAYNVLLSLAHLQDSADALLVLSNDALHRVVTQRWALRSASLVEMNALAARHLACLLQPSRDLHGLHTCLGDVASELGCHGSMKQVGLFQVPQEPPAMAAFSCSSWQGLVRALGKMQRCHSATDEAMGTEKRPPTCVASLAVARGEGLSALNTTDLACRHATFVEAGHELSVWTNPHKFLGSARTLLLASNSDACVPHLDLLVSRAWCRFTEAAYLHHYARHGLQAEDMADAFVRVEQAIASYKQLSR